MDGKDGGEGGAINQSEEIRGRGSKTEKGRNRESKQSQNRASKTEKGRNRESKQSQIERQKQKRVENRLSKHEANPKPIVKVRKQVKNRNIAEIITVKLAKYTKTPTAKIAKTPNREF